MSTKSLSPPVPGSQQHFALIISGLGRTEFSLLKLLVSHMSSGSLEVAKPVDLLSKELGLKVRATQYAIKKLKDRGLISRSSASRLFSQCVTTICSTHIVHCIKNPSSVPQVKKSSAAKKIAQPKPYVFLKDPARFENVQHELQQALHSSIAYWNFIRSGFKSIEFNAPLTTEVQSRKLSTGERGGTHKYRSRNVRLSKADVEMANIARYAQKEFLEVTFRVNSHSHPLILIDDLDASNLCLLPDACAILETSPGNYQASIVAPRVLSSKEFVLVEDAFFEMLGGGDRGAKGIRQLRRLPGSINNKPELSTAFVTRVERISERLTLTLQELDDLIKTGRQIRGMCELDAEAPAEAQNCSGASVSSIENDSALALNNAVKRGGTNDQSASGRDFGKAIELIRKGLDDASIIQQIMVSAGDRKKYGHAPGHPSHLVYAQGTVSRARSTYKSGAPLHKFNLKGKTHTALHVSPEVPQDQIAQP
jgi:hypothetical protein